MIGPVARNARWSILAVGLVGLAVFRPLLAARPEKTKPSIPVEAIAQDKLTPINFGAEFCSGCHSPSTKLKSDLCRLIEFPIWDTKDKHKNAFKILTADRAKRMGDLLGVADVSKDNRCVACHGIVAKEGVESQQFTQEEGVTCVACHGAFQEWVTNHQVPSSPKWRKLTREQKQADFGMVDLWDPVVRTEKCASCHIGDVKEGKYLTHEMYAAGHPPLPSVEVATFGDQEPRHWQYLREKSDKIQKLLQFDKNELERTKLVVLGGLVELRQSAALLAEGAVPAPRILTEST